MRIQLRDALIEHQKKCDEMKMILYDKINRFSKAIKTIKQDLEKVPLEEDEFTWFSSYPKGLSADISLMIAKYLGMNQCVLYIRGIGHPGTEPDVFHAWLPIKWIKYPNVLTIIIDCCGEFIQ